MLRKFFMDFCPNLKGNFKVNVKMNAYNGGPKGYAYIEFENEEVSDEWYDLQGRRIQKPTKAGLYILNGKKTVINNK